MAIQFKRSTEASRAESEVILEQGQPLYTTDANMLYIGDGVTEAKDLHGTAIGLNVENGAVEPTENELYKGGSIISAWKYDDDAVYTIAELPVASGHESIAWGKSCKATGKRAVAIGNNNKSGGNCSVAMGQSNTVAPLTGSSGSGTFVLGYANTATRNYSFTVGCKNTNNGEATVILGAENNSGTNTTKAVLIGEKNTANSNSQVIIGRNNTGKQAYQVMLGNNLSPNYGSTIIGNYAAEKNSILGRNPDVVIAAGSATLGKNAIEIYHGMIDSVGQRTPAHCKILFEPVEDDDAVRLKELTAEEQARILKDNNLQAQLDTETSRATTRESELDAKIEAEKVTRIEADSYLNEQIEHEASLRELADSNLQEQLYSTGTKWYQGNHKGLVIRDIPEDDYLIVVQCRHSEGFCTPFIISGLLQGSLIRKTTSGSIKMSVSNTTITFKLDTYDSTLTISEVAGNTYYYDFMVSLISLRNKSYELSGDVER